MLNCGVAGEKLSWPWLVNETLPLDQPFEAMMEHEPRLGVGVGVQSQGPLQSEPVGGTYAPLPQEFTAVALQETMSLFIPLELWSGIQAKALGKLGAFLLFMMKLVMLISPGPVEPAQLAPTHPNGRTVTVAVAFALPFELEQVKS